MSFGSGGQQKVFQRDALKSLSVLVGVKARRTTCFAAHIDALAQVKKSLDVFVLLRVCASVNLGDNDWTNEKAGFRFQQQQKARDNRGLLFEQVNDDVGVNFFDGAAGVESAAGISLAMISSGGRDGSFMRIPERFTSVGSTIGPPYPSARRSDAAAVKSPACSSSA